MGGGHIKEWCRPSFRRIQVHKSRMEAHRNFSSHVHLMFPFSGGKVKVKSHMGQRRKRLANHLLAKATRGSRLGPRPSAVFSQAAPRFATDTGSAMQVVLELLRNCFFFRHSTFDTFQGQPQKFSARAASGQGDRISQREGAFIVAVLPPQILFDLTVLRVLYLFTVFFIFVFTLQCRRFAVFLCNSASVFVAHLHNAMLVTTDW